MAYSLIEGYIFEIYLCQQMGNKQSKHKKQLQQFLQPEMKSEESNARIIEKQGKREEEKSFSGMIENDIMKYIGVQFRRHDIPVSGEDCVHTIYIPGEKWERTFYLGHGFGGSSLMYFPIIKTLRKYGNVVLWEIFGMGLSQKPSRFDVNTEGITQFFLSPIEKMLNFYQHENIVMINHSFSAYLSLRYLLMNPQDNRVTSLILLSPVGITPKENDYKNEIHSCSDIFNTLMSKFGWTFNLTYKSPLRTICSCFKEKLIKDSFEEYELNEEELNLMVNIFLTMIALPDGSQNVFFNYFQPRVIPKQPLQPMLNKQKIKQQVKIYFGEEDWADRSGCNNLAKTQPNFSVSVLEKCSHMLPLHLTQLKSIIQQKYAN